MTIFRSKPSYVKGRKRSRIRTALWNIFAVGGLIAFVFGPAYLAQELYGTTRPTGRHIRMVRIIIGAAIIAPFAILFVRMWWQSRGADGALRRGTGAGLDDPAKQSQIDNQ